MFPIRACELLCRGWVDSRRSNQRLGRGYQSHFAGRVPVAALCQTHRPIEVENDDAHIRAGGGGCHVHVEHPGRHVRTLNRRSMLARGNRCPGMDVRGDGGYAIFCGCNHNGCHQTLRPPVPYSFDQLPNDLHQFLNGSPVRGILEAANA